MSRPGNTRERSFALFMLGLVLFNPPILSLFSIDGRLFGVPVLFIYLFGAWAAFIVLLVLSAGWRDAMLRRRAADRQADAVD